MFLGLGSYSQHIWGISRKLTLCMLGRLLMSALPMALIANTFWMMNYGLCFYTLPVFKLHLLIFSSLCVCVCMHTFAF